MSRENGKLKGNYYTPEKMFYIEGYYVAIKSLLIPINFKFLGVKIYIDVCDERPLYDEMKDKIADKAKHMLSHGVDTSGYNDKPCDKQPIPDIIRYRYVWRRLGYNKEKDFLED